MKTLRTSDYLSSLLVNLDDHVREYTEMSDHAAMEAKEKESRGEDSNSTELVAQMFSFQAIAAKNIADNIRSFMESEGLPIDGNAQPLEMRIL